MSCFLKQHIHTKSRSDCVCVDELESDWNNMREGQREKTDTSHIDTSVCLSAGFKTVLYKSVLFLCI